MSTTILSGIAIGIYLLVSIWLVRHLFVLKTAPPDIKARVILFAGLGLIVHAAVLYQTILPGHGLHMGFYNALSLMSWVILLLVIVLAVIRPAENLAVIFLPAAAVAMLLELAFNVEHRVILSGSSAIGLRLHILLSLAAYALLSIAAVQSLILALQEYQLRHKHPVQAMRILPPMQTMEELLVQLLAIGFFLLSLSLATGLVFVHDIMQQHLAHKTVLSILAWLLFGTVLLGRWLRGWRGRTLSRWILGGFVLLMLAYFGSKLVLELILERT
ncbi:MAG: cytochrome c biogenesis protein CcsA [Gammaproteobacteria bacterium]